MIRKTLYAKSGGVIVPVQGDLKPLDITPTPLTLSTIPKVTVTAGSAHVKGSWVEVIAAADMDYTCIEIGIDSTFVNGTAIRMLLDIGFGALASEVVQIANLAIGGIATATGALPPTLRYVIPFKVPNATRISVRAQCNVGLRTGLVYIRLMKLPPGMRTAYAVDAIGANTATSGGVALTPSGTLNAKGAWVQLISSTLYDYVGMMVGVQVSANATPQSALSIDVGVGAASSEVVAVGDLIYATTTNETIQLYSPLETLYWADIAAGQRLSMRFSRSNASSTIEAMLYMIREI